MVPLPCGGAVSNITVLCFVVVEVPPNFPSVLDITFLYPVPKIPILKKAVHPANSFKVKYGSSPPVVPRTVLPLTTHEHWIWLSMDVSNCQAPPK